MRYRSHFYLMPSHLHVHQNAAKATVGAYLFAVEKSLLVLTNSSNGTTIEVQAALSRSSCERTLK